MEIRIEPASPEAYELMRKWRYPPPYDFYDGDVDPPENPERFFAARDEDGELIGFYYFEPNPPDLDYGLGLRPTSPGAGSASSSSSQASGSPASSTGRAVSTCTSRSSTSAPCGSTSAPASA